MTDQVDEVKSKIDLVEVAASYFPLKKSGRNFAALCPFHGEKTPSFMISPERQVFKCFGCGESGDVFTFLEKVEGWDFRETLEELAKRVGVKLTSFAPTQASKLKEKLIAVNNLASRFYSHLLSNHPLGQKARDYLVKRSIKKSTWAQFSLGYAPAGWENILSFLSKRAFSLADIATAGLVVARDTARISSGQGYYDRFRDRIIFPLKDSRGQILGFSARTIEQETRNPSITLRVNKKPAVAKALAGRQETRNEPKYINSPETPIFTKGAILFGLDCARESIKKKNEAILVEGEFDVLSAHQVGVTNIVASKGTALTERQVAILARLCTNVSLCFDRDIAGDFASHRGIELLDLAGVNVKVVELGKYKDPDEFIRAKPSEFKKTLDEARDIYDYLIESAIRRNDPKTPQGKKKIGQETIGTIAKISDDLVRAHYIEKLAKLLDLEVSLVAAAVEKNKSSGNKAGDLTEELSPVESIASSSKLEEYFLALFLHQEEVFFKIVARVNPSDFENDDACRFWKWLRDIIRSSKTKNIKKLLIKLPGDLNKFVDNLYLVNIREEFFEKEFWAEEITKTANRLKQFALRRQIMTISAELKSAQKKKDNQKIGNLTKKFDEVSKLLKETAT